MATLSVLLAPLLLEGTGSCTDPTLGMGGGVGRGLALFACPSGQPLTWLPAKDLLARHGLNPGEAAEAVTGLARMVLSFLTGCHSFLLCIKHASPKPNAFSHPYTPSVSPEWQQTSADCQQAASCPTSSQAGPHSSQPPGP